MQCRYQFIFIPNAIQIMMRNQIHRQKQSITYKTIKGNIHNFKTNSQNNHSYIQNKSICSVQIANIAEDIVQNIVKDRSQFFRSTFFGKIGKIIDPKRILNNTMDKFKSGSSHEKKLSGQTQRNFNKSKSISKQYSQRSSFIIQQLNESHKNSKNSPPIRYNPTSNKKQQVDELHKIDIVRDIQALRYHQQCYINGLSSNNVSSHIKNREINPIQKQNRIVSKKNQEDQPCYQSFKDSKLQIIETIKEKMKNKLPRKYIYHSLKDKHQSWNKIRLKTHQNFHQIFESDNDCSQQNNQSVRLHCKPKKQTKNVYVVREKNLRKVNQHVHTLRLQSKPCLIQLNSYSLPHSLQSPIQQLWKECQKSQPTQSINKLKSKRQIYQQIIVSIKNSNISSSSPLKKPKNKSTTQNVESNLLTPWNNEQEDIL